MASTVVRRPLPALIALIALLLLTGIVWWRVLHRDSSAEAKGCPSPSTSSTSSTSSAPTTSATALPAAASITVQVLNSTKRNGIAAAARTTLIADGFQVPALAANDSAAAKKTNTGVAQIRFGALGAPAALHLRYYFPGATMVRSTSTNATVVVALGAKYTKIATPAAVAAAMKAAKVGIATATPTPTPSGSASSTCSP